MQSAGQVQSPNSNDEQTTQQQQQQQQVGSPSTAAAAGEEDKQLKYHHQMLYPTPGLRNYGFDDDFMIHTFKVCAGQLCVRRIRLAAGNLRAQ
jgi:hypothetical protein